MNSEISKFGKPISARGAKPPATKDLKKKRQPQLSKASRVTG